MFVLLDLAILFAVLALIFWILAISGIFSLGSISYILLVLAIIFFIVWLVFRVVGYRRPVAVQSEAVAV